MKIEREYQQILQPLIAERDNSLLASLGIELLEVRPELLIGTMPVDARTRQPYGLLHGGASVALAETLASIGGLLHIDTRQFVTVGQEINANHIRPKREGLVRGFSEPLHIGKTSQVWQTKIVDEQNKLICISRCTLRVIPRS